jgi:acetolactate synthase-1/2/3 large subunit
MSMGENHAIAGLDVGLRETGLNCADSLAAMLAQFGVRKAFGVLGGGIAHFHASLRAAGIEVIHARHESGAAFMATELHFASDAPVVVFTTTGPGATNVLTGLVSAAWDGAKLIAVIGGTDLHQRGRGAFQETGPQSLQVGAWVNRDASLDAMTLEGPSQLSSVYRRLRAGLRQPGGYLASVTLPLGVQTCPSNSYRRTLARRPQLRPSPALINEVHERLRDGDFVIWAGFGARKAAAAVRELAERSGVHVMCSARAKGAFPESHPQYLGVTSMFGGDTRVREHMLVQRPRNVLVLGTRLGQSTSCFDAALRPRQCFIHVDIDSSAFGLAYPEIETFGVQAEVGPLLEGLIRRWPARRPVQLLPRPRTSVPVDDGGPVHPLALMAAIQRVVVEGSDAIVLTDAGNSFAWGNAELRFDEPRRYRTTSGFAAMTSATAGVVGAALGSGRPAVAIAGDGAMLMTNEVSTAVEHGVDAKWIVLNDASYGMVHHGMVAIGLEPMDASLPRTNFEMLATALGATGLRVTRASELDEALRRMLAIPGPVILDVAIDPRPAPPFGRRNTALSKGWE